MATRKPEPEPEPVRTPRFTFTGYPHGTWWWEIPELRERAVRQIRDGVPPSHPWWRDVAPLEVQAELAAEALQ